MVKIGSIGQGDNFGQKSNFGKSGQKMKLLQLRPEKENIGICRPEKKTL